MEDNEARNDWEFPDARLLTEQQRQELCRMLFTTLLERRMNGRAGKQAQAADVASIFHNFPIYLWSDNFSLSFLRSIFEGYQQKYQGIECFNSVKMLDEITKEE